MTWYTPVWTVDEPAGTFFCQFNLQVNLQKKFPENKNETLSPSLCSTKQVGEMAGVEF